MTGLIVAACGPSDPSGLATDGTEVGEDSLPSTEPTGSPPAEAAQPDDPAPCGAEMPVFVADLDGDDPGNVDGTDGPGPGSIPATDGQLVTHWLGRYANYELRWPPDEPSDDARPATVAGLAATEPEVGDGRVRVTVRLDERGDRCSELSVEVYGPRPDPLLDEIHGFAESLRDRSELAAHLDRVDSERERAEAGTERPPGECAEPLVIADTDDRGRPSDAVAAELAGRFLRDRLTGRRAQDCLTVSALDRYDQPSDPELCLFECADGAALTGPDPLILDPFGRSSEGTNILALVRLDTTPGSYREQLEVRTVEQPDGASHALIADVVAYPASYVDLDRAAELVDEFLTALAGGDHATAAGLLVNEGYTQEVEDALGDVYDDDVAELLRRYCRRALCAADATIAGIMSAGLYRAEVEVRFETPDGPVTGTISVGSFEGHLSIGSLPPVSP